MKLHLEEKYQLTQCHKWSQQSADECMPKHKAPLNPTAVL